MGTKSKKTEATPKSEKEEELLAPWHWSRYTLRFVDNPCQNRWIFLKELLPVENSYQSRGKA